MTFERAIKVLGEIATIAMRFFRPVVFTLLTILFVSGYWFPVAAETWLTIAGKTPDWLAYLITAMVIGVAAEKGLRELGEAIKAVKSSD